MIRISQIKLPAEHTKVQLEQKIKKAVHHATLKNLRGTFRIYTDPHTFSGFCSTFSETLKL